MSPASQDTPHPPATAEFGHVTAGGSTHAYPSDGSWRVRKFSVGEWDNNVYVIEALGEAILVDGANDAERILAELAGLELRAILQTHNHFDHTQALRRLVAAFGTPVFAHPDDPMPVVTRPLADGDEIDVGDQAVRALHTPGHTPGSMCYLIGNHLFTGDTLFPGGPGNTDGDKRRFEQVMESCDRLFELPDLTRVSPGHGLDTTIGRERPSLEIWRARGW